MISPSWGLPPRRRPKRWGERFRLFSRIRREHPLGGQPGCRDRPGSRAQDLAVALRNSQGDASRSASMATSSDLVRDRGASVPDALPTKLLLGVLAGGHGVERGAGHAEKNDQSGADPPQAVGQGIRAGRGGGTHRRDLRRPKGPITKISVLASSSSTWRWESGAISTNLDGAMGNVGLTVRTPLRCLSEASIPPRFHHRHCSMPEDLYAQLARQKLHK